MDKKYLLEYRKELEDKYNKIQSEVQKSNDELTQLRGEYRLVNNLLIKFETDDKKGK